MAKAKISNLDVLFRLGRVALTPGATLKRRIGKNIWISGINREGHGMRAVYLYGETCEGGIGLLSHFLDRGDTFIDIGANIGIYSLVAGEIVGPSGTVVAVEPFVSTANQLFRNVMMNRLDQVRVRICAMGSVPGHASLHMNLDRPVSFSMVDDGKAKGAVDVQVDSLDNMLAKEDVRHVRFVKMDVEGFEHEVLLGGREMILRDRPIVQFECYDDSKFEDVLGGYILFRFIDVAGNPQDVNVLAFHESDPKLEHARTLKSQLQEVV